MSAISSIEIVEQIVAARMTSQIQPLSFNEEEPVMAIIDPALKAATPNALTRFRRWKFSFAAPRSL